MTAAHILVKIVIENMLFRQSAHFVEVQITFQIFFKRIRKEKEKAPAVDASENRQTGRTPRKWFRCESEDHLIENFPKPPKDYEKRWKQVSFYEKGNRACGNGKNNSNQKIYASMARMSGNDECTSECFGDSSQLTNWILDSGATCHMTP